MTSLPIYSDLLWFQQQLLEASPLGTLLISSDLVILYVNSAFERITGYAREELLGQGLGFLHSSSSQDQPAFQQIHESLRNQTACEVTLRHERKDGTLFWDEISLTPLRDQQGQLSYWLAQHKDVTQDKDHLHQLQVSEARYHRLFEKIEDAAWCVDAKTSELIYTNNNIETIYGRTAQEFKDHPSLWYETIHPDDRHRANSTNSEVIAAGGKDIEYRIIRADGSICWVRDRAWVIYDDEGQPLRLEGLLMDNTSYKQAQAQAFEIALEKERIELLTTFIHHAAHEFRTPLAIIGVSLYTMIQSPDIEKRERYGQRIEDQIQRITKLLDNLLVIVKLKSGETVSMSSIRLSRLLEAQSSRLDKNNSGPLILYDIDPVPSIQGYEAYLGIAFQHLLENALRYTPAEGRITIRLRQESENVVIEWADTGKGISPDALPHIFDIFWREDDAHTTPGFGLGLAIVKQIIKMHRGEIEVESELGRGSLFRVRLPLTQNLH